MRAAAIYEGVGVAEYYILDASGKHMAFYQRTPDGDDVPINFGRAGVIRSQVLPGFQFRIADLYRQPTLNKRVLVLTVWPPEYVNWALTKVDLTASPSSTVTGLIALPGDDQGFMITDEDIIEAQREMGGNFVKTSPNTASTSVAPPPGCAP